MRRDCKHEKTFEIHGHCSDLFSWNYNDNGWSDPNYAPSIDGLCSGDDIEIKICLICQQVIGLSVEDIEAVIEEHQMADLGGDDIDEYDEDE